MTTSKNKPRGFFFLKLLFYLHYYDHITGKGTLISLKNGRPDITDDTQVSLFAEYTAINDILSSTKRLHETQCNENL